MELYNFFTEIVHVNDKDKYDELLACYEELKNECTSISLVKFTGITGEERYSIIGQIYGADTNAGDLILLSTFINIKYTWFDAFCDTINNIKKST